MKAIDLFKLEPQILELIHISLRRLKTPKDEQDKINRSHATTEKILHVKMAKFFKDLT